MKKTVFFIGSQGIMKILEENKLQLDINPADQLKVKVIQDDKIILDGIIPENELLLNKESKVYQQYPAQVTKTRVIRWVFHKLVLAGILSFVIPDNVELFKIELVKPKA